MVTVIYSFFVNLHAYYILEFAYEIYLIVKEKLKRQSFISKKVISHKPSPE